MGHLINISIVRGGFITGKNKENKNKNERKHVNILGTDYTIIIVNNKDSKEYIEGDLDDCDGSCMDNANLIYVKGIPLISEPEFSNDINDNNMFNMVLRHEIIHAFMNECGLRQCSAAVEAWAENEEMVDFFAFQIPKIYKVYKELGIEEDKTIK